MLVATLVGEEKVEALEKLRIMMATQSWNQKAQKKVSSENISNDKKQ